LRDLNEVDHPIDGDDQVGDDRVISGFDGIADRNHRMPFTTSEIPPFLKTMKLSRCYEALAHRPPVEPLVTAPFHAD
jgi:hypothetical protein